MITRENLSEVIRIPSVHLQLWERNRASDL